MAAAHAPAQRVFDSGVPSYGLTTGYIAQKRVAMTPEDASRFNRSQIQDHRAGQGPPATYDVVRAAMLCLANLFAGGTTVVRPELADALVEALFAVQALDLRVVPLGRGTAAARELVRDKIPRRAGSRGVPADPGLLGGLIRSGALGDPEVERGR